MNRRQVLSGEPRVTPIDLEPPQTTTDFRSLRLDTSRECRGPTLVVIGSSSDRNLDHESSRT